MPTSFAETPVGTSGRLASSFERNTTSVPSSSSAARRGPAAGATVAKSSTSTSEHRTTPHLAVRSSETQRGLEREAEYARERLVPARQALTPARLRECRLERARVVAIGYQHEVGRARSKTQAGDDVVTSAREAEI